MKSPRGDYYQGDVADPHRTLHIIERHLATALAEATRAERERIEPALETAQRILTTCRNLFGGGGLGGPGALEADCDFALRKIALALRAVAPTGEGAP